ncbi:MAG: DUF21 domain-containing protein [Prevotella sp.]|nr:DUF21 domain-containing protein [Candidatus Equicola faecalis]
MTALLIFLSSAMGISFLCSILEASLMSTPISFITMREEEGYAPAKRFKKYKLDSARPIASILALNTIANTIGAAGVGAEATKVFGSEWFGVVSAVVTIFILIFSEIIPKTIGTTHWKRLMGFTAGAIRCTIFIMYPIVLMVEGLTRLITPKEQDEPEISREEVSAMANVAEEEEELDEDENLMIQNIIKMDDIPVKDVMTPRVVAQIAPESMTVRAFYRNKAFAPHSRIPVYADSDEYISGYILRSEVLQLLAEDKFDRTLSSIRRDISLYHQEAPVGEVWDSMRKGDEQISCIIDDYGCFQGIVSLEDLIETILGSEIIDEKDTVADMQQLARQRWQKRAGKEGTQK